MKLASSCVPQRVAPTDFDVDFERFVILWNFHLIQLTCASHSVIFITLGKSFISQCSTLLKTSSGVTVKVPGREYTSHNSYGWNSRRIGYSLTNYEKRTSPVSIS